MRFIHKKTLIVGIISLGLYPTAFASNTGTYLGIAAGYGMTNWENLVDDASKDKGAISRIFIGYDFSKSLAIELGYTNFFSKTDIQEVNTTIRTQAFDLLGKIKAPLSDKFDIYAKTGLGYLMSNLKSNSYGSRNNFNIAYGLGLEYSISQNVIADISWLRYDGKITYDFNKYQPDADTFMIGLRYVLFTDKSSTTVYQSANDQSPYLGLGIGYDITHWKVGNYHYDNFIVNMSKDSGIASRIFAGYDFNKYFAAEVGFTYFSNRAEENHAPSPVITSVVLTQALDFLGKIKAPLTDNFDFYAKAGLGYLMSYPKSTNTDTVINRENINIAYGIGLDYSITSNIIADISWLRYHGHAKMNLNYQPNADTFMIGLRYKFNI
ncbi:MAG: porin family protein [Gammaproteobacteria bacterium]